MAEKFVLLAGRDRHFNAEGRIREAFLHNASEFDDILRHSEYEWGEDARTT
jgi:hypothetical protein